MSDIQKKWKCTDEYLDQFLPIMVQPGNYEETLYTGANPLIECIEKSTNTEIRAKHYIEPWILKSINTDEARWKLRQPYLTKELLDDQGFEQHVLAKLSQLSHPFYKRLTVLDKDNGIKIKFYSMEARKNFCLRYQGLHWARNIDTMSDLTWRIPRILKFIPNWRHNLYVAVFEYIEGTVLSDKYEWTDQYDDHGKPDVRAGRADPYWGKVCGVNYKDMRYVKSEIKDVFADLCKASRQLDFSQCPVQQLDNEPEWEEIWQPETDDKIWHIDDWNLENIIETPQGYRLINVDRSVVTSLNNCIQRFITDFRTETNIKWNSRELHDATSLEKRSA